MLTEGLRIYEKESDALFSQVVTSSLETSQKQNLQEIFNIDEAGKFCVYIVVSRCSNSNSTRQHL